MINAQQVSYQVGRFFYEWSDLCVVYPATAQFAFTTGRSVMYSLETGYGERYLEAAVSASWLAVGLFLSGFCARARYGLWRDRKFVLTAEKHPLEFVERIIVDDVTGLEALLEKTRESRGLCEWGTVLKSAVDKKRAVLSCVHPYEETIKDCFVKVESSGHIVVDEKKIEASGFNGFHHYHPTLGLKCFGARNFSVSHIDRYACPKNWVNLLSFNLPNGPEVIGFNRQFTYIPKYASKRELVLATPQDIMSYLRR